MKKQFMTLANAIKKVANELDEAGKARLEEIAAAVVGLAENADDDGKAEIAARLEQLRADLDKVQAEAGEQVAEKMQTLRNEMMGLMNAGKKAADFMTPEVCAQVRNAITRNHGADAIKNAIEKVCKENGIEIRKKNGVTGLTFSEIIDLAIQLKQEDNDEIFDALYETNRTKWFYGELDPTDPTNIAHKWNKSSTDPKAEQALALSGKKISTAYIYKLQGLANEDLDDAREAGQEAELLRDIRSELERAVKGLAVRALLIGDAYNGDGAQVDTFETIGTKTRSDLFTTVVAPAGATATHADVRKVASKVKTEKKWAIMTSDLKLQLSQRPAGADSYFFTDEELAAQLGVDRVIEKDFISEVDGLQVIVFDPSQYWVKVKNTIDTAFPDIRNNKQGYIFEKNMGGAIHGLESSAILTTNAQGSSKASK